MYNNYSLGRYLIHPAAFSLRKDAIRYHDVIFRGKFAEFFDAIRSDDIVVVKQYLQLFFEEEGWDLNKMKTSMGDTALTLAAIKGSLDIIRLLLDAGADIDKKNSDGKTPLICAAVCGHVELVRFFSGKGAKRWLKDRSGFSAYDYLGSDTILDQDRVWESRLPAIRWYEGISGESAGSISEYFDDELALRGVLEYLYCDREDEELEWLRKYNRIHL
jgi:hypothetical protein